MKKNGLMLDLPKPKWSEIVAGCRNKNLEVELREEHMISTIITMQVSSNKKSPSCVKKSPSTTNNLEVSKKTAASNPPSERTKKHQQNKHKIVLVGDSHARDCFTKLQDVLPDHCEVISYVKPGAGITALTKVVEKKMSLTEEDMLIFWRGTNGIVRNNSARGIKKTHNYLTENLHTNIIYVNAPVRFDLSELPVINEETRTFIEIWIEFPVSLSTQTS